MRLKLPLTIIGLSLLFAAVASAQDFGAHIGYYASDLKAAYVGADLMLPVGPAAIVPNLDYSKKSGIGYWFGSVDLDLRNPLGGVPFWVGAGPTYGYFTGYGSSGSSIYGGSSTSNTYKQWGWDLNGGIALSAASLKPYVTARYIKIKSFHTTGAAIGLRF